MNNLKQYIIEKLHLNKDIDIYKKYRGKVSYEVINTVFEEVFPSGRLSYQPASKELYIVNVYIKESKSTDKKIDEILNKLNEILSIDLNRCEYFYNNTSTPFYYQINIYY